MIISELVKLERNNCLFYIICKGNSLFGNFYIWFFINLFYFLEKKKERKEKVQVIKLVNIIRRKYRNYGGLFRSCLVL